MRCCFGRLVLCHEGCHFRCWRFVIWFRNVLLGFEVSVYAFRWFFNLKMLAYLFLNSWCFVCFMFVVILVCNLRLCEHVIGIWNFILLLIARTRCMCKQCVYCLCVVVVFFHVSCNCFLCSFACVDRYTSPPAGNQVDVLPPALHNESKCCRRCESFGASGRVSYNICCGQLLLVSYLFGNLVFVSTGGICSQAVYAYKFSFVSTRNNSFFVRCVFAKFWSKWKSATWWHVLVHIFGFVS